MTGTVELAPVDARVTRLTVCGMYEPPFGRLGKHLDDAVMHKFAEATVRELAGSIAKRLETARAPRQRVY
jgi:predicted RNA methylase